MSFLYPSLLYLLTLTIVPVIIHLINLRKYRTLYFSSLFFLRNTIEQTKKTRNLFDILILIARILFIAALVLAFAQPIFSDREIGQTENLNIVIDNTFSMQAENSNGNFFEQARQKAYELVDELDNSIPINVHSLSHGALGKELTKEQAMKVIGELQLQHGLVSLNQIIRSAETNQKSGRYVVLSDFQSNTLHPDTILQDSLIEVNAIVLTGRTANVSVDTIWFDAPAQWLNTPVKVFATLRNHSDNQVEELPVRTMVNNELYAAGTVSIEPRGSIVFETSVDLKQTGVQKIYVETDDLPISFDNRYYSGIYISPKIPVIEIGQEPSPYLKALLNDSSYIEHSFVSPGSITPSALKNAKAIVINGNVELSEGTVATIKEQISRGLNMVVNPGSIDNLTFFNEMLVGLELPAFNQIMTDTSIVSQADMNHPVLKNALDEFNKNMDLPVLSRNYIIQPKRNWVSVLFNDFGNPLLVHQKVSNGNVYLFGFDALGKEFALNPLFVPIMYNAITVTGKNTLHHITCNKNSILPVPLSEISGEKPPIIQGRGIEFIPFSYMQQNSYLINVKEGQIVNPGYFDVLHNEIPIITFVANHNSQESVGEYLSPDELTSRYFTSNNFTVNSQTQRASEILSPIKQLWRIFVAIAFVFILLEIWLLKLKRKKESKPSNNL